MSSILSQRSSFLKDLKLDTEVIAKKKKIIFKSNWKNIKTEMCVQYKLLILKFNSRNFYGHINN